VFAIPVPDTPVVVVVAAPTPELLPNMLPLPVLSVEVVELVPNIPAAKVCVVNTSENTSTAINTVSFFNS
jgi:hypothetical protein